MAVIKITQFGGLQPSVDARNLPPDGAQTALNLNLRYGDFRPSKGPGASVASVLAGTKSIFRTPSGTWLSSSTDTDYVNGQIADAASDRVYLTGRSAYPEAWQGGTYRRLGVPAPSAKPSVTAIVADELTQSDADAAQIAATNAVLAAVHALITTPLLGNAAPTGVAPPVLTPDPLYSKVALHLPFTSPLVGGRFKDLSPQARVITHESNVTLATDNLGPLGAAGTGYAAIAGGANCGITFPEIRRWRDEADPTWCIDASVTSAVDLEYIQLECRNGNMREVVFRKPTTGDYVVLFGNEYGGEFSTQLKVKRTTGADVCAAGVPVHLRIKCTGSTVQVYIDGVLSGSTPNAEGLELSVIGRSNRPGRVSDFAWQGKIDEVRVTLDQRETGNFTPPAAPYSTGAVPTGFWVTHGDALATGLPTTASTDAAYLVQLSLSGGAWVATNPADDYLRDGSLGGAQVTYSGSQYWAVPALKYRALGKAVEQTALAASLATVDNPASPGTPLLTGPQSTALAAEIYAVTNASIAPVLPYIEALNTKQAELKTQLATPTDAASLVTKISLMKSASKAIEDYFAGLDDLIKAILSSEASTLFGAITSKIVTRLIETRGYVVTFVTDWGEESAPSDPSELLEIDQNDSVKVVAVSPPAGRHIVGWRLYRSSTTNSGAAFQLVDGSGAVNGVMSGGSFAYLDISNLSFVDDKKQEELQEVCPSLTWAEPPENLQGLVGLPNGMMAGFFGKTLCLCEPYQPYAWPLEYQLTLEFKIVGIGVFGQTAVVLTEGNPYYASGADSASYSAQKIESTQACISKRTIAGVEGGVMYASPDGLCLASPAGVQVFSEGAFSRDDWQAEVSAASFGAFHDGVYYLVTG